MSAGNNIELLARQIKEFKPLIVSVKEEESIDRLKKLMGKHVPEIYAGMEGLIKLSENNELEMVVVALVGHIGLIPTIRAIESGKDIALANKETLVIGGEIIKELILRKGVKLLPVDSEHSAVFQCLVNKSGNDISRIILTASGGPFRNTPREKLEYITPEEALAHPTWSMGPKITIDSATLMNKGFEVIEARWLFNVDVEQIQVMVHPQSIIHSLVEFKDRSVFAQMSPPDMRLPIQYALSYPERWDGSRLKPLDLVEIGRLEFEAPCIERFPCLSLAYKAIKEGGTSPAVLNGANEVAVGAFLEKKISFQRIYKLISQVLEEHIPGDGKSLESVLKATNWAMGRTRELVEEEGS
ncbi:MAG: 1-deoxy-D-xylulose 5-phosphate reductoisomerase [bacterium ADurb.Bin363]|nr:MAG: 1-deoxy-D-xylulose 5-phosphate reductoisomerase [bacterium ADurb.Bin363]